EVLWKYPEDYYKQDVLGTIPKFCFPFDMTSVANESGATFRSVLFIEEGEPREVWCRSRLHDNVCVCVCCAFFSSYLPWFDVFHRLLNTLAEHINKAEARPRTLARTYARVLGRILEMAVKIPVVDHSIISLDSFNHHQPWSNPHLTYFISPDLRELPTIPENRNLTEFTVAVDVPSTLQLYASLLNERRIIVTSSKISTLSSCIHALALLLYPMSWQHVYIPLLPPHLLEYCSAPMPFLIGVHSSLMD
uniref:UDENN domain-containing protein n=1 Tax=Petromyzon marinus TaxID=7757 RepID=S4RUS8_PETMA